MDLRSFAPPGQTGTIAGSQRQASASADHPLAIMVKVLVITVFSYVVAQLIQNPLNPALHVASGSVSGDFVEAAVITLVSALLLWQLVLRPLRTRSRQAQIAVADREATLVTEAAEQEFRARLHRALEMSSTEIAAYGVANRALELVLPGHRSELLLADSSESHLKMAVSRAPEGSPPGCGVGAPHDCPAIRRGQTADYPSDDELDSCPFLLGRGPGETAAVCVPVSMIGRSIGVLHTVAPAAEHPDSATIGQVEVVADQVGARIGMLRVMEQTHLQAATDSLTGLINRRTVENRVREMVQRGVRFSLAMGDLDNFKSLNDMHGHEAGDRALRQFARVMCKSLRADDLISRFGGEEFVIVLPGMESHQAVAALQRAQEHLLVSLAQGDVPAFTVSFGVAHSDSSTSLEDLIRLADHALFVAKREGRNRVVLDPSSLASDHEIIDFS